MSDQESQEKKENVMDRKGEKSCCFSGWPFLLSFALSVLQILKTVISNK